MDLELQAQFEIGQEFITNRALKVFCNKGKNDISYKVIPKGSHYTFEIDRAGWTGKYPKKVIKEVKYEF